MGWGRRFPQEQQAAQHALLASSAAISSALSAFAGWLLAVSGASFALMISNLEKISPHMDVRSFKWVIAWFGFSLLMGLIARMLGVGVAGSIAAISAVQDRVDRVGPIPGFSQLAFTKLLSDGLLPIHRWSAWRGYRRSKSGDQIGSIRAITYQSQLQGLLVTGQLLFLFIAVLVLANGIEA